MEKTKDKFLNYLEEICRITEERVKKERFITAKTKAIMNKNSNIFEKLDLNCLYNEEHVVSRRNDVATLDKLNEISHELIEVLNKTNENGYEDSNFTFCDFDTLSSYIIDSIFYIEEQFDIIMLFIKANLSSGISPERQKELSGSNHDIVKDKIARAADVQKYSELLYKDESELTDDEKILKQKYDEYFKDKRENSKDIESIIGAHNEIKVHYLDKKDDYSLEDVAKIKDALLQLGVYEEVCNELATYLEKKLYIKSSAKCSQKNDVKINIKFETEEDRKKKEEEKENDKQELESYIDSRYMKPLRYLSMDEILYVVSLLQKLKYDEESIRQFLMLSEVKIQNPIAKYVQFRDKLKYYEEKYALSKELNELEGYFKELFLLGGEEYKFFKQCFESELNKVLKLIPNDYEYELKR